MNRFYQQYGVSHWDDPVPRYAQAVGTALILFGIFAHGRMGFFWIGVALCAVSGLL